MIKIVIADDHRLLLEGLAQALDAIPDLKVVATAGDGEEMLAAAEAHRPDVILLDIEMPRMDGYQFATHVRNDPKLKDIPIIMVTSRSGEKHRARAIEIGVNDYLSKPYQEADMVAAIEALVGRSL